MAPAPLSNRNLSVPAWMTQGLNGVNASQLSMSMETSPASPGSCTLPAPDPDLGISASIGDWRHQQNSQRTQKPRSAQGNAHASEPDSSEIPDRFYLTIIHISEVKPALLSWEFTRSEVLELPLLLLSAFPISTSQREEGNLPESFNQDSPVPTSPAGPAGELGSGGSRSSFLSAAHTEIPRRQPHTAAARGEPCTWLPVFPVLPVSPHTHRKSPLTGTDPPAVTELTQIPTELSLLPRLFWFSSTLMRFGKGDLNVLHSRDFLCPIQLCFGDFLSSHSSSGSSSPHILMAIVIPALWNRF